MTTREHIKTRVLLLSDTHGKALNPLSSPLPYRYPLPKADIAIHTGDLTLIGSIEEHIQAINTLRNLQADLKIVIPGNHDLTLDTAYYSRKGDIHGPRPKYTDEQLQAIRTMYTGPEAQAANIAYLEEGIRTFHLLNGAKLTIYASAYTPEFCDWAFAYPRDEDRFNHPEAGTPVPDYHPNNDDNIDIILTHGPPYGILDQVNNMLGGKCLHVGCDNLLRAVARAKPLLHCFGHIHEGWGAVRKTWPAQLDSLASPSAEEVAVGCESVPVDAAKAAVDMGVHYDATDIQRGRETLFVNSSVLNVRYKPNQAPWVVDLVLPKGL